MALHAISLKQYLLVEACRKLSTSDLKGLVMVDKMLKGV